MDLLKKFKETAISVIPIMLIVLIMGLSFVPLDKILLARFVISGVLLIFGLTVFLIGVDLGIQPMGTLCGAALTKRRSLLLLLVVAFIIGFIVTAAEPDIQVFGDQVKNVFPYIDKNTLTMSIAIGVGIFISIGLFRNISNFSIKISFLIAYSLLFLVSFFSSKEFIGIAFDAGGATTGPMTVPFIMALGLGVSAVRSGKENNSFGLTGICSVGPVMAVLIYSIILQRFFNTNEIITTDIQQNLSTSLNNSKENLFYLIFSPFSKVFPHVIKEALISILPLLGLFIIFQIFLLKLPPIQITRIVIGFIYSFIGLSIFLTGVNGGFSNAGAILGQKLGELAITKGGIWYFILILTGLIFGAIIVSAEPAVWVLSEQVEQNSGGTIKRKYLLIFLSIGTAIAIGLAIIRSIKGFDIKYILIPGYILALILMIFSPDLFSGIAFDSGGVASGPLTSTFILSFTIGAASSTSNTSDSFGVIALVAMMPLIAIQLMGIIFKKKMIQTMGVS